MRSPSDDRPDVAVDEEGFLLDPKTWTPDIANHLAEREGITLTPEHWEIISLLREFHESFHLAPAMRPLCRYIKLRLCDEKAKSIYLLTLFPGSPAKLAAKIAGLPKPPNCL